MELTKLKVKKRVEVGKKARKALKRDGYIPATMIGHGRESVSLGIPKAEFIVLLKAHHGEYSGILLDLEIEGNGGNQTVLIQRTYVNALSREFDNIDLRVVVMDEVIHVTTTVVLSGIPVGIASGGILEQVRHDVEIRTLPRSLPEHLSLDVSGLGVGENLKVSDIVHDPEIEILTPADEVIATVIAPSVVKEVLAEGAEAVEAAPAAPAE